MKRWMMGGVFLLSGLMTAPSQAGEWQLFPEMVFYNADALRSANLGGLAVNYRFHSDWAVSGECYAGKVSYDGRLSPDVDDGDLFLVAIADIVFNTPARFGDEGDPWRAQIYTSAGPMWVKAGKAKGWGGYIGGGMDVYTRWPWLAVRFDLKNFFYRLPNPRGSGFNSDMSFALGPLFIF